jgi:preprotein translocase SecE subunit
VAKSRAQRKAERKKREAQQARQAQADRRSDSKAQAETQVPESADVIEAELAEKGADIDALRDEVESADGADTKAPAPSRADVGKPADEDERPKESRRERKRREREEARAKEERRLAREKKSRAAAEPEKERNAVAAFIASCWAELKRVQWPDRETLIQASAVVVLFVAVMAAYLGALDFVFSRLVDLFIS